MVHGCAIGDRWCRWVRVRVDDFVAALFAFADYGGYAAEDAFAFGVCALFGVAVEDFGGGEEAGFREVWWWGLVGFEWVEGWCGVVWLGGRKGRKPGAGMFYVQSGRRRHDLEKNK